MLQSYFVVGNTSRHTAGASSCWHQGIAPEIFTQVTTRGKSLVQRLPRLAGVSPIVLYSRKKLFPAFATVCLQDEGKRVSVYTFPAPHTSSGQLQEVLIRYTSYLAVKSILKSAWHHARGHTLTGARCGRPAGHNSAWPAPADAWPPPALQMSQSRHPLARQPTLGHCRQPTPTPARCSL